jgi:hypothetical protein
MMKGRAIRHSFEKVPFKDPHPPSNMTDVTKDRKIYF